MENITLGHWIFAGIWLLLFIVYLSWVYLKDRVRYRYHYRGIDSFLLCIVVLLCTIYLLRQFLRSS